MLHFLFSRPDLRASVRYVLSLLVSSKGHRSAPRHKGTLRQRCTILLCVCMSELGNGNMVAATKSVDEMMNRSVNKRMLLSVEYLLHPMPYYANK